LTTADAVSVRRAATAARVAADKLGHDIVALEVGPILSIVDYFVIVSATNTRQVRTIVDEVQRALEVDGAAIGVEGLDDATWVLVDFGDVVVHVFEQETRAYYALERLWADAARLDWEREPAPVAAERP
jgi:ribosome-associated protein